MKASVQKYVLEPRLALLLKAVPLEVNVFYFTMPSLCHHGQGLNN